MFVLFVKRTVSTCLNLLYQKVYGFNVLGNSFIHPTVYKSTNNLLSVIFATMRAITYVILISYTVHHQVLEERYIQEFPN